MPSSQRQGPLPAFRFVVEKEGKAIPQVTRVTGLMLESGLFFPDTPGASLLPVPHVVVQRGVTDDTQLWDWVKMTRKDPTLRYDIRILLMDASGKAFDVWRLVKAYPVRWYGPDLIADTSAVAFEMLELGYERIDWELPDGTSV